MDVYTGFFNVQRGWQSLNTGPRFYLRPIRRTGWLLIYTSRTTDGCPFKPKKLSVQFLYPGVGPLLEDQCFQDGETWCLFYPWHALWEGGCTNKRNITGADPGFQVRGGAHLKKLRRAERGAKIFGVFRLKNHDFTPKNHIFSNCGGRRENFWGISCENSRFYAKKSYFFQLQGGAPPPPGSAPALKVIIVSVILELPLSVGGVGRWT